MATDMCYVHNLFIRGLNSIYLQSPYVKTPNDIADLLFYTRCLLDCIMAHHDGEEMYVFPDLEELTGDPEIMQVNTDQHEAFHDGIETLLEYTKITDPATGYSQERFIEIIDSFAPALYTHLKEEIDTLLALDKYPSEPLKAMWAKADKHINDVGSFDEMFPLAFGCSDKGFEGGKHKHPPVPYVMKMVVKYWFARKHQGAWRFCPCDFDGTPKRLYFLP
ncbi:hypothetical protein PRZ48_014724 [Zasmidium cellare]|uniref:Hemerythrin-like domain-containing protein n=1 Tax=Zasmidium cellare TaxID=395010 RepID=A0ABR0DZQ7_ZASCE|nr:hypothetical protein PRZ48_014724 [Zasmidium cellare]